jgi:hypothetical protein
MLFGKFRLRLRKICSDGGISPCQYG